MNQIFIDRLWKHSPLLLERRCFVPEGFRLVRDAQAGRVVEVDPAVVAAMRPFVYWRVIKGLQDLLARYQALQVGEGGRWEEGMCVAALMLKEVYDL
jgi:hypothetical protein